MVTIQSMGSGYYNYYHDKHRYETPDGKASEVWYHRDLSKEEIASTNSGEWNRESKNADLFRKLESTYADIAVRNRAKYQTVDELYSGVYWKYFDKDSSYSGYSHEEKMAMFNNEMSMTRWGTIRTEHTDIPTLLKDPHLNGEVTTNKSTDTREFNSRMLSAQIGNVFKNNGIDLSLLGNSSFRFSVNGMTNMLTVSLLSGNTGSTADANLLKKMTEALNSNNNAQKLFYNLLYDGTKQGTTPKDQLAKWGLWNNFQSVTGEDIRTYQQTADGFVNKNGEKARDIFKEGLKTTTTVPAQFKGAAYDYFLEQEKKAMQYDIASTADLTFSMIYQNATAILSPSSDSQFEAFA
ncbi:DUF4885 family protein [Selenomonas sp. AB3002]|uniref:DUF4885 family protein n=1 Tax=Selenomonas sp. AB3002 TaxID=1392502 RepID=UPI00049643B8